MLLAGVILILVIFALIGWRKGVIRLVLSLVSMIITIMAAVVIAPLATTAIKNNTNIDENIAQSIYTLLYENKEVDEYFEDKQVLPGDIDVSQVESHIQTVTEVVSEVGDKINLPESLTEAVKAMPDSELMSVIREYGEASVKEITIRVIAFRLADIVLTAIAYLVIMVVVSIVLSSDRVNKKTSSNKAGRQAGWINSRTDRGNCSRMDILYRCDSNKRNTNSF